MCETRGNEAAGQAPLRLRSRVRAVLPCLGAGRRAGGQPKQAAWTSPEHRASAVEKPHGRIEAQTEPAREGRCGRAPGGHVVSPASVGSTWPVSELLSRLHSQAIAAAISSGCNRRPWSGLCAKSSTLVKS